MVESAATDVVFASTRREYKGPAVVRWLLVPMLPDRTIHLAAFSSAAGKIILAESRLAGRGAYVCQDTACLELAIKKGALSRALETPLPAAFLEAVTSGAITTNTQGEARGQE